MIIIIELILIIQKYLFNSRKFNLVVQLIIVRLNEVILGNIKFHINSVSI